MNFTFSNTLLEIRHLRWPMLLYAATWTSILTLTVAVASFSPELAFVLAISPSSALSQLCSEPGAVGLPLDVPSESFCFPSRVLKRSRMDFIVPPIFAAVIVAGSTCLVKAMGLWEAEEEQL